MEIIGLGSMYRQHPHEGQNPSHHPNSYNQYQNVNAMNGRRSMSTHFEPAYPVYPTNHVGYNLSYQTGYDYVPQQPQGMVPSYHAQAQHHHAMQPPQSMYAPAPPLPPPQAPTMNTTMHGLRDHTSPQQSPTVKRERASPQRPQSAVVRSMTENGENGEESGAKTDVDTLMRAIQARTVDVDMASPISNQMSLHHHASPNQHGFSQERDANGKPKKKYQCEFSSCGKFFFQKTHLEIHMRAHTGQKPFLCREPNCGQRFSQLGNLKTHERRHTGEKPYSCDACGKRFAQRGNVRAHRVVHEQIKPFTCKLDNCGKNFTQLGNLKSHQNKFHANTIQNLTSKFASSHSIEAVSVADRELWEYFSTLYKNSNRGIKGRGKDRRIATAGSPVSSRSDSGKGGNRIRKAGKDDPSSQLMHHGHHGLPPLRGYSNPSSTSGTSEHE